MNAGTRLDDVFMIDASIGDSHALTDGKHSQDKGKGSVRLRRIRLRGVFLGVVSVNEWRGMNGERLGQAKIYVGKLHQNNGYVNK